MNFFTTDYPPHDPARRTDSDGMEDRSPTNGDNARSAAAACPPPKPDSHDSDEWYADLICNLLHLAHSRDLDPAEIITSALNNFHAEAGPMEESDDDSDPESKPFHDAYWKSAEAIASTENAAPAPPLFWYAITGRIPGSDEDSCSIFQVANYEEAAAAFRAEMLEGEDEEAIREQWGEAIIINHVLRSETEIA